VRLVAVEAAVVELVAVSGLDIDCRDLAARDPRRVRVGAAHTRNTYFSAQFWRLARRIGKKKAAVAVGHSILVISWHLLREGCTYEDLGGDFFTKRDTDRARQRAIAQLEALGYKVSLEQAA